MVMIGLPVLVITLLLTLLEIADISSREGLGSNIGAADARIKTTSFRGEVYQDVAGRLWAAPADPVESTRPWTASEVTALLGAGTRLVPANQGSVDVRGKEGYDHVSAHEVDLRDPLAAGLYRLVEGRLPASPQEVVISPEMRERGARLGATLAVTRQDRPVRVVGVIEHPHELARAEIVGFPGVLLLDRRDGNGTGWLADTPQPVTWADVRRLNAAGLVAQSRAVIADPPADTAPYTPANNANQIVAIGLAGVMIVLEVVLLAGPAFAVGLRRRRRELALIAAQGGSRGTCAWSSWPTASSSAAGRRRWASFSASVSPASRSCWRRAAGRQGGPLDIPGGRSPPWPCWVCSAGSPPPWSRPFRRAARTWRRCWAGAGARRATAPDVPCWGRSCSWRESWRPSSPSGWRRCGSSPPRCSPSSG
nr:hypothetical protein GCM10020093_056100 [Planobispora longispora]